MSEEAEKKDKVLMEMLKKGQQAATERILEVFEVVQTISSVVPKLIQEGKIPIDVKSLDGIPGIAEDTEIVLEIADEIRPALLGAEEIKYRLAKSELKIKFEE
jgi:hypothetical protein